MATGSCFPRDPSKSNSQSNGKQLRREHRKMRRVYIYTNKKYIYTGNKLKFLEEKNIPIKKYMW